MLFLRNFSPFPVVASLRLIESTELKSLVFEDKPAGGAGLTGGRQPPRGVSRTKTDTQCRFWEGGQHVPPPRVKKRA